MPKISIAEVKRRLTPGTIYVGEFVGVNRRLCAPGMERTQRRVTKNNSELASVFLTGPKTGQSIYLKWSNVTADERDGVIYLTLTEVNPPEEFLAISEIGEHNAALVQTQ